MFYILLIGSVTDKAIGDYSITVRVSSIWHSQTIDVAIKTNRIIESSPQCFRAPAENGDCEENDLPPYNYTVDILFVKLEGRKPHEKLRWFETKYDPKYKMPIVIQDNDPDSIDEEFVVEVLEFCVQK